VLDAGRLQDGDAFLAATALRPVARVAADLADRLGLRGGESVDVATAVGAVTLPAVIAGRVAPGTVWLPECSPGSTIRQALGASHGSRVRLSPTPTDILPSTPAGTPIRTEATR